MIAGGNFVSFPLAICVKKSDLFIDVYSIFTVFFTLFIVFLATHCILFIFLLAISFFESKVVGRG
jgi:hypothetical protein